MTKLAWRFLAALLILSAIAITAYRLAPARLSGSLTAGASELLTGFFGLPVRIGSIDLTWRITGPVAEVRNVALLNADGAREIVRFERGVFSLSLSRSLMAWAPVIDTVKVSGFALNVLLEPDGRLAIRPERDASPAVAPTGEELLAWANRMPDLLLSEGSVLVEGLPGRGTPLNLVDLALALRNDNEGHQLILTGGAPGLGSNLRLVVRLPPAEEFAGLPDASIYFEGRQLDLGTVSTWLTGEQHTLGVAETRAWLRWRSDGIDELWLETQGYGLRSPSAPENAMIEELEAVVHATREGTVWAVSIPSLTLGWSQRRGASIGPVAAYMDDQRRSTVHLRRLPADALHAVAAAFDQIPPEFQADLAAASPGGELSDLRLALNAESEGRFRMSGRFGGLHMDAAGSLPAVSGLDGQFSIVPGEIAFDLDSREAVVDLPHLFREPLEFERAAGQLAIRWGDDGWDVEAPDTVLETAHVATRTRLRVSKKVQEPKPFLDLQVYVEDGDAAYISRYLPVGAMKKRLIDWLDRAIVGGRVRRGGVLLRGPASAFPFRNGEGVFQALLAVEDAVLDYRGGWPRVENGDALVSFRNQRLEVHGTEGSLLGVPVGPAHGRIEDLWISALDLEIRAEVESTELLQFVAATPLQATIGAALAPMEFNGRNTVEVKLQVPLRGGKPISVEGGIGFEDGRIALPGWNVEIDHVRGVAGFTEGGVHIRDLRGRWFETELTIDASQEPNALRVSGRGEIEASRLLAVAKLPPGLGIEGSSEWLMNVIIPKASAAFQIELSSDLVGTTVSLPAPLEKDSDVARSLALTLDMERGAASTARVRYGGLLDGLIEFDGLPAAPTLQRASLHLGDGEVEPLPDAGLAVRGALDALRLQPWLALGEGGLSPSALPPLRDANVRIGTLSTELGELRDVWIRYEPERWRVDIGDGLASGEISASGPDGKIRARLHRLDLGSANSKRRKWPDPTSIPPLDLEVAEFALNGQFLGGLTLEAAPVPGGLELTKLALSGPDIDLASSGSWARADDETASIAGVLESPDLGRLTRGLGFDLAMEDASAEIEFDLRWPDALLSPDLSGMEGSLSLVIGQGRLSDVDPGVGRVLGLVNLRSLGRRLSLDFSDVLDEGFAFDGMEGHFNVRAGDAYTEDFVIKGPSARIDVQGRVGLASQDYDQLITVTPDVSGTIPIAAAIAAGPIVGAAVLLAEQLVGSGIDRGSSVQYEVSGPWDDPKIERVEPEPFESQRTPEELISR